MKSVYAALIALFIYTPASAQVVTLSPSPVLQFINADGSPASGGELFTYQAGTTTKLTTYTDATGATPNTDPIILDTRGDANVWLTPGIAYKFILAPAGSSDPPTSPIWTVDNISTGSTSVVTTTALQNTTRASVPSGVVLRLDAGTGVGAPPEWFISETGTCSSNSRTNDVGSCVDAVDGNSWFNRPDGNTFLVSEFGVSSTATAAANTTALNASGSAAYKNGMRRNLCINSLSAIPIVVNFNGAFIYSGEHIDSCLNTIYTMQATGPAFSTIPSPGASPGVNWQYPITITDLSVNQNNEAGAGLLIEGFWNSILDHISVTGVADCITACWTHNDTVNVTGTYPDAAIMVKGITGVAGAYYNTINNPILIQPGFSPSQGPSSIVGGYGLWLGTTAGDTSTIANVTRVNGGIIAGFTAGCKISAAGDFAMTKTDLSENTIGCDVGGDLREANRAVFDRVYTESTPSAPEYIGIWFHSNTQFGSATPQSNIAQIFCIDDSTSSGGNQCGTTKTTGSPFIPMTNTGASTTTLIERSIEVGWHLFTLGGGGGSGGGATASTASNNSIGTGGGAGGVIKALCFDPTQDHLLGATLVVGAGGLAGTAGSTGNVGGNSSISDALTLTRDWTATTAMTKRTGTSANTSYVLPTVGNAASHLFAAIVSGTTASSHPTWPQTAGQTVTDGTVTWEDLGPTTWSAGMTIFVDNVNLIGSIILPSQNNANNFVYKAAMPGVAGGSAPSFTQQLQSETQDGTGMWYSLGPLVSLTAGGGGAGTVISGDTQAVGTGVGQNGGNTAVGGVNCKVTQSSDGVFGGPVSFDNGYGWSGQGGSISPYGRGGQQITFQNTSNQNPGNASSSGSSGGGGGATSVNNSSGTAQQGGAGMDGFIIDQSYAGGINGS